MPEQKEREVRCLNCFERFQVDKGIEKVSCPKCKKEWRISWPRPDQAKIRGPA